MCVCLFPYTNIFMLLVFKGWFSSIVILFWMFRYPMYCLLLESADWRCFYSVYTMWCDFFHHLIDSPSVLLLELVIYWSEVCGCVVAEYDVTKVCRYSRVSINQSGRLPSSTLLWIPNLLCLRLWLLIVFTNSIDERSRSVWWEQHIRTGHHLQTEHVINSQTNNVNVCVGGWEMTDRQRTIRWEREKGERARER